MVLLPEATPRYASKAPSVFRPAVVYEAFSGHLTHVKNFMRFLESRTGVEPTYLGMTPENALPALAKLPVLRSAWSIRASLAAYGKLRGQVRHLDVVLFHTHVLSLFSVGLMRRTPTVLSTDATPLQFDRLGTAYGHTPNLDTPLGKIKDRLNRRAFKATRHLVVWSQWAKDSFVTDYGVPSAKISVILPGIDTAQWDFPRSPEKTGGTVNLLFVGYDFARKGGETLLAALDALAPSVPVHLHVVSKTADACARRSNVTVYDDLTPNSAPLLALYQQADVFVFPTQADFTPLAVMEAMASGLPVITTAVAALPELVSHNVSGLVVPPNDTEALAEAIRSLVSDRELRLHLGAAAREIAVRQFEACENYAALARTLESVSAGR